MKNQTDLLEKLFDAKLEPLANDIKDIKRGLNGNGRIGLYQRMDCVEDNQKNMLGKIGMISAFFGLMIAGMIEIITRFFSKKLGL